MRHAIYEKYKSQEAKAYTIENLQKMMTPTLREEFVGIKVSARPIEEAFEWIINVIKSKSVEKYIGLEDIVLDPLFKLFCYP